MAAVVAVRVLPPRLLPLGGGAAPSGWSLGESESGVNKMEDLRARLKAKIEAGVARKAEESQEKIAKARSGGRRRRKPRRPRRNENNALKPRWVTSSTVRWAVTRRVRAAANEDSSASGAAGAGGKGGDTTGDDSLQFGRIEVDGKITGRSKQKRASKEVLLKRALDQRAEIEAAVVKTPPPARRLRRSTHGTRRCRAGGSKVLDDPKLLQKASKTRRVRRRRARRSGPSTYRLHRGTDGCQAEET